MSDIELGKYYNIESDIHSMNPAFKVICLILFSILAFITKDFLVIISMTVFTMLLIIISNVEPRIYIKLLKTILTLIIFIIIINIIFSVSLSSTILSVSKLILIVLYASIITFTTTPKDITNAIEKILYPFSLFKINTKQIALTISLAIRFVPIILEQGLKVSKAQASRGLDFKQGKLKEKIKAISSIILPLFTLSLKRSDEIADIMEIRLYNINRVNKNKYNINMFDNLMIISHILLVTIYIFKEVIL